MNKIASFCINHDILKPRLYLSRIDKDIVTYDLRMNKPNNDDYLDQTGLHTLEYLSAAYSYLEYNLTKTRQYKEYSDVTQKIMGANVSYPIEVSA